jgi:hypothetical protein
MKTVRKLKLLIGISFFVSMPFFSNCLEPCPEPIEPVLGVRFTNVNSPVLYQTATAKETKNVFNNSNGFFSLALSLNQDQLTYFFSNGIRTDTLTLSYKRDFKFESERCGFVLNILDLKITNPTSFKSVKIENDNGIFSTSYFINVTIDD